MAILALYPFQWFQSILACFPLRWYVLHTFVDSIYGFHKNGTQPGVRDYRWCASVFFFVRFCQFVLYGAISGRIAYNIMISIVLILYMIFLVVMQPFSVPYYNTIHMVALHLLSLFSLSTIAVSVTEIVAPRYESIFYLLITVLSTLPLLYFTGSILHLLYSKRSFVTDFIRQLRAWRNGYDLLLEIADGLPDRIENSEDYPRDNLANFSTLHDHENALA